MKITHWTWARPGCHPTLAVAKKLQKNVADSRRRYFVPGVRERQDEIICASEPSLLAVVTATARSQSHPAPRLRGRWRNIRIALIFRLAQMQTESKEVEI